MTQTPPKDRSEWSAWGKPRPRIGPIVATVASGAPVLAILLLLWAWWGVRAVRQTLVAETERDARALLESVVLASQYSVATASLVDQLEHEAQAAQAREAIGMVDPRRVTKDNLAALAARA